MNQSEKNSKPNADNYVDLEKEYGIEFEGRILPEKWGEYTSLFEEIRRFGELRPREFIEMFPPDDKYVLDKRVHAAELTNEAWNCLEIADSEIGWRGEVEFKAFKSFDSEVVCHVCLKRRWKPKFEAEPVDKAEAEMLRRRRGRRVLCTCTVLQQATIRVGDQCSKMFTREIDKRIDRDDLPDHLSRPPKRRRPDRVIGLKITPTLRQFLPSSRSRYCPFNKKTNVVYPFIVIEAKTAESNDATFSSILQQTALVIHKCLRLQQNLQEDTDIPFQCIVWSFSIIGEEWRLYGAVPNGSKIQIFDLWHGTVLFPEGALQLVLIMDYLCDWACEVYRMNVIRCLTGGGPNFLNSRLSRSGTDTSSQASDAELIAAREMSLPLQPSLVPELSNGTMMGLTGNSSREIPEIELLVQIDPNTLSDKGDIYSWQRWATTDQDLWPWTRKATIRHSNRVELTYLQVAMPEDIALLQACLKACFPVLSTKDIARKLLISLQDDNLAVTTSVKASSWQGFQLQESTVEVRALVYFRSELGPEEWQITRHMLCILCSEKAIIGLAEIAEISPSIHSSSHRSDDTQCERFLLAINSLNLIGGTRSAGLALAKRQLSLRAVIDDSWSSNFEWSKFSSQSDAGVTGAELHGILSNAVKKQEVSMPDRLKPYIKKKRCIYTIPPSGSDQQGPPAMSLELPSFRTQGFLIKIPALSWAEAAQKFCFFVIKEDVRFNDETTLGQLLEDSVKANDLFAANAKYEQSERAVIERWVRILKGQLPQDTVLE